MKVYGYQMKFFEIVTNNYTSFIKYTLFEKKSFSNVKTDQ